MRLPISGAVQKQLLHNNQLKKTASENEIIHVSVSVVQKYCRDAAGAAVKAAAVRNSSTFWRMKG